MRRAFCDYLKATPEELAQIWKDAAFSFDASVLLNVFGYSTNTQQQLLQVLEGLKERVWLPHQFGLEYFRNRAKVIIKQVANYLHVENELKKLHKEKIIPLRDHPFFSRKAQSAFDRILRELEGNRKAMEALISTDPHTDRILSVFDGRVGAAPSQQELKQWHDEARARYQQKVPPGYEDLKEKGDPGAFGDFIGWVQLIEICKQHKKPVILVTDDSTEDWWQIEKERRVGPRPELVVEFRGKAGQRLHMYNSESFLRDAERFLETPIDKGTLAEVKERLSAAIEDQRSAKPSDVETLLKYYDALSPPDSSKPERVSEPENRPKQIPVKPEQDAP
ncbi:MAG: PIN domain-containing protein [Planctomycetota bacterium]